ncbi:sulfatase, partial [Micromonospora chalcea]
MAERTLAPPRDHAAGPDRRERPPWWRSEAARLAEVTALVGLVVTQPLLDVLGRSPDFFLFHRASRGDVLLLVALIALAPTALFGLLGAFA